MCVDTVLEAFWRISAGERNGEEEGDEGGADWEEKGEFCWLFYRRKDDRDGGLRVAGCLAAVVAGDSEMVA